MRGSPQSDDPPGLAWCDLRENRPVKQKLKVRGSSAVKRSGDSVLDDSVTVTGCMAGGVILNQ